MSTSVKKNYRVSNKKDGQFVEFSTKEYNRQLVLDSLVDGEDVASGAKGCMAQAVATGKNVMATGKNMVRVPLTILSGSATADQLWYLREGMSDTRRETIERLIETTQGITFLPARLGMFLYRDSHEGAEPPRGDARNANNLPGPDFDLVEICSTLAVAPGKVAAYRRGFKEAMPVRTGIFHGRQWSCDVEIMGEEEHNGKVVEVSWFAKVILLFR